MTDEGNTYEVDYKAEYEKVVAERDAYATKLNEYIDANNKLNADLKVQQAINRKTIGVSNEPDTDVTVKKVSLKDAIDDYKLRLLKGDKKND